MNTTVNSNDGHSNRRSLEREFRRDKYTFKMLYVLLALITILLLPNWSAILKADWPAALARYTGISTVAFSMVASLLPTIDLPSYRPPIDGVQLVAALNNTCAAYTCWRFHQPISRSAFYAIAELVVRRGCGRSNRTCLPLDDAIADNARRIDHPYDTAIRTSKLSCARATFDTCAQATTFSSWVRDIGTRFNKTIGTR